MVSQRVSSPLLIHSQVPAKDVWHEETTRCSRGISHTVPESISCQYTKVSQKWEDFWKKRHSQMYFSWNTTVFVYTYVYKSNLYRLIGRLKLKFYVPILGTVLYFSIPQACSAVLYACVFVDDQDGLWAHQTTRRDEADGYWDQHYSCRYLRMNEKWARNSLWNHMRLPATWIAGSWGEISQFDVLYKTITNIITIILIKIHKYTSFTSKANVLTNCKPNFVHLHKNANACRT